MSSSLEKEKPEVRLRAFRAVDEPETCALFIEGHTHVLTSIGITKVTSSKNEWTTNPSSFVMVVESLDGKVVYGGARVHVAGGTQQLPIEQATAAMDPGVFGLVWQYAQQGTGELCGLWNSRQIAGYGIGSIFLIRTAVAVSYQIGIQSLFALCAPYTIPPGVAVGMEHETTIGENGTFYYPKLDLVATTMLLKDVPVLSKAYEEDKNAIMKIRDSQKIIRTEILRKKEITIHYDIEIQNLKQWDLNISIAQAKTNYLNSKISDQDPNII